MFLPNFRPVLFSRFLFTGGNSADKILRPIAGFFNLDTQLFPEPVCRHIVKKRVPPQHVLRDQQIITQFPAFQLL